MAKVVTQKQIDEIVRLKDEALLSFQDIGKQLNLGVFGSIFSAAL